MNIDRIKQNVSSIAEVVKVYNQLEERKKDSKDKNEIKKIDEKLKEAENYFLRLSSNLQVLIDEEIRTYEH